MKEIKVINASGESSSSQNKTSPQLSQPLLERIDKWKSSHQNQLDNTPVIAEDADRTFKCSKCAEHFYFQVGLGTRMEHAHSKEKENRSDVNVQKESPLPDIIAPKKSSRIPSKPKILQVSSKNSENIRKNSGKSLISDSSSGEVTSSPIFVASTPKKTVQKRTNKEKGKSITLKITQKPLCVSSRLKIKLDKKLQEDIQPLPRWSKRNLNSSVEYVEEYPEDDSDSDMVTAPSANDVTEDTSPDKNEKKKENTLNEEDNENEKGVDKKTVEQGNIQRDPDRKSTTPEMSKEIVTRSKVKTTQNSVAANVKEKMKNEVTNVCPTDADKEKIVDSEKEKAKSAIRNVRPEEANEERNAEVQKEKPKMKVRNICSKDADEKNISDVPKKKAKLQS